MVIRAARKQGSKLLDEQDFGVGEADRKSCYEADEGRMSERKNNLKNLTSTPVLLLRYSCTFEFRLIHSLILLLALHCVDALRLHLASTSPWVPEAQGNFMDSRDGGTRQCSIATDHFLHGCRS